MTCRLIDAIRANPLLPRLSRIRVTPGPRTTVNLHFAGWRGNCGRLQDAATGEPVLPGDGTPPVGLMAHEAESDQQVAIESHDILGQLAELTGSGLVGVLNVERIGNGWIASTHAGTQEERTRWLLGLNAPPDNVRSIR